MAIFKLTRASLQSKTWKAAGIHPKTGKNVILQGGQHAILAPKQDLKIDLNNRKSENIVEMTPKEYLNSFAWHDLKSLYGTIDIPDELFT